MIHGKMTSNELRKKIGEWSWDYQKKLAISFIKENIEALEENVDRRIKNEPALKLIRLVIQREILSLGLEAFEKNKHPEDQLMGWRCFFCGFTTCNKEEAAAHFGSGDGEEALCLDWNSWSEQERIKAVQDLLVELEGERERSADLEAERDNLRCELRDLKEASE